MARRAEWNTPAAMTRNTPSKTPLAMSLTENALDFVFSIVTVAMNIMHIFTVTKGWTAKSVLGAHSDDNLKLQSEWFTSYYAFEVAYTGAMTIHHLIFAIRCILDTMLVTTQLNTVGVVRMPTIVPRSYDTVLCLLWALVAGAFPGRPQGDSDHAADEMKVYQAGQMRYVIACTWAAIHLAKLVTYIGLAIYERKVRTAEAAAEASNAKAAAESSNAEKGVASGAFQGSGRREVQRMQADAIDPPVLAFYPVKW